MQNNRITLDNNAQQGVALIATLMVVVMVAILGMTVIQRTLSAKKSDNSLRDMEAACLAAESALRDGTVVALEHYKNAGWDLYGKAEREYFDQTFSDSGASWYKIESNWVSAAGSNFQILTDFSAVSGASSLLAGDPMFRLELVQESPYDLTGFSGAKVRELFFRVSSKGFGRTEAAICKRQGIVKTVASRFENDE